LSLELAEIGIPGQDAVGHNASSMLGPAVRRLAYMEDDMPSPVAERVDFVLRADPQAPLGAAEIMLLRAHQVKRHQLI
jgi:hypothetical protein